jgi:CelD/BcsL family acetyltransferase involved in cellulose biosynthesis
MQVRVREVTTRGELSSLGAHWDKVVQAAGDVSPFLSLDWITSWWGHFCEGRELFVLMAEDGEGTAGLAPFVISRYRYLGFPLRVLEFAGAPFRGRCLSTRLDFIVGRRAEECLAGFAEKMGEQAGRWDLCSLRGVPADSPHVGRLGELAGSGLALLRAGVHQVPFIPTLGRDWQQYLASRSRSFRYWLRRSQQRAQKAGLGSVERVADPRDVDAIIPHLSRVCQASWKAAHDKGLFLSRDPTAEFLAAFLRRACEEGQLLLTTLSSREEIIAYHIAFFHSGVLWFYDTAYDAEHGRAAPGFSLFAHMIQEGFRSGVDRIDLGPGLQPYKMRWAGDREERANWLGFHRGCRSRVLQLGARWAMRLRHLRKQRSSAASAHSENEPR